jgi:hypothetical protein
MTASVKQDLEALDQSIKTNTPKVQEQLSKSGVTPDPAVVFSAAKYYATIEKLAKE